MTALAASLREQPCSLWPRFFQIRSGSGFVLSCTASPPESESMSEPSGHTAHQIPICVNLSAMGHCLFWKERQRKGTKVTCRINKAPLLLILHVLWIEVKAAVQHKKTLWKMNTLIKISWTIKLIGFYSRCTHRNMSTILYFSISLGQFFPHIGVSTSQSYYLQLVNTCFCVGIAK